MDRRSPPLPLTAITRTGSRVNGSSSVNFELVFPPPKLVMRRSAPSKLDRYRSSSSGSSTHRAASSSFHRLSRNFVAVTLASGTSEFQVVEEASVVRIPLVRGGGLEAFHGKRALDDRPRFRERWHGPGREHLHRDVAERRRFDGAGNHRAPSGVSRELIQQPVARSAADDANLGE